MALLYSKEARVAARCQQDEQASQYCASLRTGRIGDADDAGSGRTARLVGLRIPPWAAHPELQPFL
eukprot:1045016-Pyramimonas_sp.AAC.1